MSTLLCALLLATPGPLPPTQHVSTSQSQRINVEFQEADIHFVLRTLADIGRVNIVPQAGVSGKVTAHLRSTTWEEALEHILMSQGLEAERDGNVIYVHPAC